jgi:preprotein translocase subunit YajC
VSSPGMVLFLQIALIFMIFYWLLIRPQRKEAERHREMIQALKKGDEVVTTGGIIGVVVHLADDRITVRSGEGTKIVLERSKVARKLGAAADANA